MTLIDDQAARAADARQAAYFRAELDAERQHLLDGIVARRALIERRTQNSRLRTEVHSAEAEVRYLGRLIARLDERFADAWPD